MLKTATAPAILVNFKASVNSTDVLIWISKYQIDKRADINEIAAGD